MSKLKALDAAIAGLVSVAAPRILSPDTQRDARQRRELLEAKVKQLLATVEAARDEVAQLEARRGALMRTGAEGDRAQYELKWLEVTLYGHVDHAGRGRKG